MRPRSPKTIFIFLHLRCSIVKTVRLLIFSLQRLFLILKKLKKNNKGLLEYLLWEFRSIGKRAGRPSRITVKLHFIYSASLIAKAHNSYLFKQCPQDAFIVFLHFLDCLSFLAKGDRTSKKLSEYEHIKCVTVKLSNCFFPGTKFVYI